MTKSPTYPCSKSVPIYAILPSTSTYSTEFDPRLVIIIISDKWSIIEIETEICGIPSEPFWQELREGKGSVIMGHVNFWMIKHYMQKETDTLCVTVHWNWKNNVWDRVLITDYL